MKKAKNNKKKRLSSLILLLFLTVIMLGTSTYAWFTANRTVTIQKIDVNVATSSGLQISADATNWKTKLSNSDITGGYTGNVNQFPSELKPVSTNGDVDTTTGHINMYSGVVGTDDAGDFVLTSEQLADAQGITGNYIAFDIFLKSDKAAPIYLTNEATVIPKANADGSAGADTGLKNAARVAFAVEGNVAATETAAKMQALAGAKKANVTIWEPNADSHTANGVSAASQYYGATLTAGETNSPLAYAGIKAPIPAGKGIKLNATNVTSNATYFETISNDSGIAKLITTNAKTTSYSQLISLAAGVTKVRVYMWIEGNDVDCENNASGSNISYNVVISQNSSAA
jgi:hypothetical protein